MEAGHSSTASPPTVPAQRDLTFQLQPLQEPSGARLTTVRTSLLRFPVRSLVFSYYISYTWTRSRKKCSSNKRGGFGSSWNNDPHNTTDLHALLAFNSEQWYNLQAAHTHHQDNIIFIINLEKSVQGNI